MTALVSENTIASTPVRSRCECAENQTVHCTTELSLFVDKLKKKTTGKERCQCTEVNVLYILSTVKTENTYTPARLEALFASSPPSPLSVVSNRHSYLPGFEVQVSLRATAFAIHADVS